MTNPLPLSEAELAILREERIGVWTPRLIATIDVLRADLTAAQRTDHECDWLKAYAEECVENEGLAERLEKAEVVAIAAMQWATSIASDDKVLLERNLRTALLNWRAALVSKEAGK